MPRKLKPSRKSIRLALVDAVFDPRVAGPMSVIVAMNNPTYCELKATELILEAQKTIDIDQVTNEVDKLDNSKNAYNNKTVQAMSLLALARVLRNA